MISELMTQFLVCVLHYGQKSQRPMIRLSTIAYRPIGLRRIAAIAAASLLLGFASQASADEESEEAADLIIAAEEALKERRYQDASRDYLAAAEISENAEVAKAATRIAYSYGFTDDGINAARRWSKLEEDSDEARLYLAQLYLRAGEIRQSRRTFEDLIEAGDDPAEEQLHRLVPLLAQEDPVYAYEVMRQLARPYKDSALAHYSVAVLALDAGETEVARERAQQAIEIDDEWVKPHLVYARSLLYDGDEEGAIDYTARLVGDDPDPDPEARIELAIMLVSAGRDDDALSQVNQVLLEQPYRTDALRLMAIINFRLEYLDAAQSDFEDLLQSGAYRMDALYYLGRIADRREEHDAAIRYYSQVTGGNNAVMAQSRVAGLLSQQGDNEKALEHIDRFAEINPNHAVDMLRTKAQLLVTLERYDEALDTFDKVIEYRPDQEGVYLSRAELMLRMGREEDAIEAYRAAAERWPDSALSLNALGYTLADRTDRYDEAEKLIRKALDMEPESAAIMDSWGWVLFKQGKHEEALTHLERAYEKLRDPEVAAHIVEVLWVLDRRDDARTTLENAELLFPDSDLLLDVRERLVDAPN